MKVPNLFVSKNAEAKSSELQLLLSFETFLKEKSPGDSFEKGYEIGERLAEKISYTKEDLENIIRNLYQSNDYATPYLVHKDFFLRYTYDKSIGLYISALVNKIIEEEPIKLSVRTLLQGVGAFHKKGTLVIEGNVGKMAGYRMLDGKLIINGNAGWATGYESTGGKIIVNGGISHVAKCCKAEVYQSDKKIWGCPDLNRDRSVPNAES